MKYKNSPEYKHPIYTRYSDGTHAHERSWGTEYCSQPHPKKLPQYAKFLIISGWFLSVVLIAHLILNSNNL